MQVSKTILISGAALILILTAAVAYLIGKSDQASGVQAPKTSEFNSSDGPPTDRAPSLPVVGNNEQLSTRQVKNTTVKVVPYSKDFSADELHLIEAFWETEEGCRGSSDEASIKKWCNLRPIARAKLQEAGICYGRESDQSAADRDIHHCGPDSFK